MGISKITRNFQVTLPKDVRELKDFKVGEKVLFLVEGNRVDIVKIDKNVVKEAGLDNERRLRKEWSKRRVE